MATKRSLALDPEYDELPNPQSGKRTKIIEERKNKAKLKIQNILQTHFDKEVQDKEDEVDRCDDVLYESRCRLDRLRACIIAKYYSVSSVKNQLSFEKQLQKLKPTSSLSQKQASDETASGIHPAIKTCLGESSNPSSSSFPLKTEENLNESESLPTNGSASPSSSQNNLSFHSDITQGVITKEMVQKAPRYRTKLQIVCGNVSKYIPPPQRRENEELTHIWKTYVRECKGYPKLSNFVKKVCFFLHPSFRPNDIIEISDPPYEVTRHGWGDFPIRIQLHFLDPRNKPVDLIHNLKLDKTYTGLTMLGPEVHADLLLYNISNTIPSPLPITKSITSPYSKPPSDPPLSTTHHHHHHHPLSAKQHIVQRLPSLSKILDGHPPPFIKKEDQATPQQIVVNPPLTPNSSAATSSSSNQLKNGITAFVKCTDSQGRTLLVPQTSLICISSPSNNASDPATSQDQNHRIPHTTSLLQSKLASVSAGQVSFPLKQSPTKLSNSNLPLYILKSAVTQQNGVNQILLISANEEKKKLLEMSTGKKLKPCITSLNGYSIAETLNKAAIPVAESHVVRHKPRLHWEKLLQDIDPNDCYSFTHILKKVLKAIIHLKQDVGVLPFPFSAIHEEHKVWNIGKMRAAEWQFAGIVRAVILKILHNKPNNFIPPHCIWTRKQIMLYCRKHGYTTLERTFVAHSKAWDGDTIANGSLCPPDDILKYLENGSNGSLIPAYDEVIDVCNDTKKDVVSKHHYTRLTDAISHISPTAVYMKQCASEILVNLKPIELEPGISVPVVEEMLLSACKEFVTDIIRAAVNSSYDRFGGKMCPAEITIWDVYLAIVKNTDFEFLTNKHLGVLNEQFVKR